MNSQSENKQNKLIEQLRYLKLLIEEEEQGTFETEMEMYKGLMNENNDQLKDGEGSILINEMEYLISQKLETIIKNKISKDSDRNFNQVFDQLVQQRIKYVENNNQKIIQRKSALYSEVNNLIHHYQQKEDGVSKVAIILKIAQGELEDLECKDLEEKENQLLMDLWKLESLKTPFEKYERIVFSLSENQLEIECLKEKYLESKNQQIIQELSRQQDQILKNNSQHYIFQYLRRYFQKYDERNENVEFAKELLELINQENKQNFVNLTKKIKQKFLYKQSINNENISKVADQRIQKIIKIVLNQTFNEQLEQQNKFLLSVIADEYQQNGKDGIDIYLLFDLIEVDQYIMNRQYDKLMICYREINNLPESNNQKEKKDQIKEKMKQESNRLEKEICDIQENDDLDHNFELALQTIQKKSIILLNETAPYESFASLSSISQNLSKYNMSKAVDQKKTKDIKSKTKELLNDIPQQQQSGVPISQKDEDNIKVKQNEFVQQLISILESEIKIGLNNQSISDQDISCEFLNHLDHNFSKDFFFLYEEYLGFRIKLQKTEGISLLDKRLIEKKLISEQQKFRKPNPNYNQLQEEQVYQFIQRINELITEGYISDILMKMEEIEIKRNQINNQYEVQKQKIVYAYEKKLKCNKRQKKSQLNFIRKLINKLYSNDYVSSSYSIITIDQQLKDTFEDIKDKKTPKEVENYFIQKTNIIGAKKLQTEITDLKEETLIKDLIKLEVDQFEIIEFMKQAIFIVETYVNDVIQILTIKLNEMNDDEITSKLQQVTPKLNLIRIILKNLLFSNEESQKQLENKREQLVNCTDQIDQIKNSTKVDNNDLIRKLNEINELILEGCYLENVYLKYYNSPESRWISQNFSVERSSFRDQILPIFKNVELHRKLDINQVMTKHQIFQQFKNQLISKKEILKNLNDTKEMLNNFINEWKLNTNELQQIQRSTDSNSTSMLIKNFINLEINSFDISQESNSIKELLKYQANDIISRDLISEQKNILIKKYVEYYQTQLRKIHNNDQQSVFQKILNIDEVTIKDQNIRLSLFLGYSELMMNNTIVNMKQLDEKSMDILQQLYQLNKSKNNSLMEIIQSKIKQNQLDGLRSIIPCLSLFSIESQEIQQKISHILQDLNTNSNQLKNIEELIPIIQDLIEYYYNRNDQKNNSQIPKRLYSLIQQNSKHLTDSQSNEQSQQQKIKQIDQIKLCNLFLTINETIDTDRLKSTTQLIQTKLQSIGEEDFIRSLLNEDELIYVDYLDIEIIKQIIRDDKLSKEEFENRYIECTSKNILQKEIAELTSSLKNNPDLMQKITELVNLTKLDANDTLLNEILSSEQSLEQKDITNQVQEKVRLISKFKKNLITSKQNQKNQLKWIQLVDLIREKKKENIITLEEAAQLLAYSNLFEDTHIFIEQIEKGSNQKEILLCILGYLLLRIPNKTENSNSESREEINKILNKIQYFTGKNGQEYIKLLISKLGDELQDKLKFEDSEMVILKDNIHNSLSRGAHRNDGLFQKLEGIKILKWNTILRQEKLKQVLQRNNKQIISNLLQIEKVKGSKLTNRFIDIIKNEEISDEDLLFILERFQKNIWELSNELLDMITKNNKKIQIDDIKEYDNQLKKEELTVSKLISQMRSLVGEREINYHIKELISSQGENCSLIEQTLLKFDPQVPDSMYNQVSSKMNNGRKISEYTKEEIHQWTIQYRQLKKSDIEAAGIGGQEVIELMAIISRASILVYKYDLRNTQKIAVLLFIHSMISTFQGRLANISTGEGKSLITITTAIASILINGGTVDILTSSQVLAERDAQESEDMFKIFGIKVSNNCDITANNDEQIRKERYENNDVIYGDIGSFQKDLLLTRYYDKEIRQQIATCLLIDEVDSMCIDRISDTLYISHPIDDLSYLKDILIYIWQAIHQQDTLQHTKDNVKKICKYIDKLIQDEQIRYPKNLKKFVERRMKEWIKNAYFAKYSIQKDKQYSLIPSGDRKGEIVINDLSTGVEQMNSQWSNGLCQFLQLKHTNKLTNESLQAIFMSNYTFFNQYKWNIYGMTGTLGADVERELLAKCYKLDFFLLPRFKKELNIREEGIVLSDTNKWLTKIEEEVNLLVNQKTIITENEIQQAKEKKNEIQSNINELQKQITLKSKDKEDKMKQLTLLEDQKLLQENMNEIDQKIKNLTEERDFLISEILKLSQKVKEDNMELENCNDILGEGNRISGGRAVLIICENKIDVEVITNLLVKNYTNVFEYLGKLDGLKKCYQNKKESIVITQVRPGDIIVATNIAGRGTDFKISSLLERNGGLHVILSYVPNNIRVEQQAFGRSGRKGEHGSGRIIAWDDRIQDLNIILEKRDQNEESSLQDTRIKQIPKIMLESELFKRFDKLQQQVKIYFSNVSSVQYKELQKNALHNKWAFWLDEMSHDIQNIYITEEIGKKEIFSKYKIFINDVQAQLERKVKGVEGFINEPSELIKLAKFNITEGNYSQAIDNCDYLIEEYGSKCTSFAYYYKATAIFQPILKEDDGDLSSKVISLIESKYFGNILSFENKKDGIKALKQAISLFEEEIQNIEGRSLLICRILEKNKDSGIGSSVDCFSQSNAVEISIIQVFLNSARSGLGSYLDIEQLSQYLHSQVLNTNESKKLFEELFQDSLKEFVKNERLSKKMKIKYHIYEEEEQLNGEDGCQIIQKKETNWNKNSNEYASPYNLSQKDLKKLDKAGISYSPEIYILDRFEKYQHIEIPSKFFYCKKRILETFEKFQQDTQVRGKKLEFNNCLTKEKVWNLFVNEKIVIENNDYLTFNKEYQSIKTKSDDIWNNEIFNGIGYLLQNELEKILHESEQKSKETKCYLPTEFENVLEIIIQRIKLMNTQFNYQEIREYLTDQQFLKICNQYKVNDYFTNIFSSDEIQIQIEKDASDKIDKLDLKNFPSLYNQETQIKQLLLQNIGQQLLKRQFESIFNQQSESKNNYILLKKILILSGISQDQIKNELKKILLSSDLDSEELDAISNILEDLFMLKYFNQDNVDLEPIDNLIVILRESKVIKRRHCNYPLSRYPNTNQMKEEIIQIVKRELGKIIDEKIRLNTFISEQEILDSKKEKNINEEQLIQQKKEKFLNTDSEQIFKLIFQTIGPLKSFEKVKVECKMLREFYQERTPSEVSEYYQLSKDIVLSFLEYHSPWSWQTTALLVFGNIQITAGAVIMVFGAPLLGPLSEYLGSALISEGGDDLIYAIRNSGNVSGRTYWNQKFWNILLTVSNAGLGAFLSRGTKIAKNTWSFSKSQVSSLVRKQLSKNNTTSAGKSIFKKVAGEVALSGVRLLQSFTIDKLDQYIISSIFERLKDTILSVLQSSSLYTGRIEKLSKLLTMLFTKNSQYSSSEQTTKLFEQFIGEAKQECDENISNTVFQIIKNIEGPLVNHIRNVADNMRYSRSDLESVPFLNRTVERNSAIIEKLITGFDIIKQGAYCISIVESIVDLLNIIIKKIEYKLDIIQKENQKKNISVNNENELQVNNEYQQQIQICIKNVDESICKYLQSKITQQFIKPICNQYLSQLTKPIRDQIENNFSEEFNQLKTMPL